MFDTSRKFTGTGYTGTIAFLVFGFIVSPAVLAFSRPVGYMSISLAAACSGMCAVVAYVNWKRFSQLSIPSIVTQTVTGE